MTKVCKSESSSCILVCTADILDPYCSLLVAKSLGVPLIIYAFDDYVHQWGDKDFFSFSRMYGPTCLKEAKKVIVPNEFLQGHYKTMYDIDCEVIHNPVNVDDFLRIPDNVQNYEQANLIKIVYTGAIYDANIDAFHTLFNALKKIDDPRIVLNIYTNQSIENTGLKKIAINVRWFTHRSLSEIPQIQKDADILYLPLAFKSSFSHSLITTSSPGKMGEYLSAGRSILVHAPSDSYVAWYFKKYDCGVVANINDVDEIMKKIKLILTDSDLRARICSVSINQALKDFDEKKIQLHFVEIIRSICEMDHN